MFTGKTSDATIVSSLFPCQSQRLGTDGFVEPVATLNDPINEWRHQRNETGQLGRDQNAKGASAGNTQPAGNFTARTLINEDAAVELERESDGLTLTGIQVGTAKEVWNCV